MPLQVFRGSARDPEVRPLRPGHTAPGVCAPLRSAVKPDILRSFARLKKWAGKVAQNTGFYAPPGRVAGAPLVRGPPIGSPLLRPRSARLWRRGTRRRGRLRGSPAIWQPQPNPRRE